MTTATEQKSHKRQHDMRLTISQMGVLMLFILILAGLGALVLKVIVFSNQISVPSFAPLAPDAYANQDLPISGEELYLFVRRADNLNSVLMVNPHSGNVDRSFDVGYNATVTLTANKRSLYVFNTAQLSAINMNTGTVTWMVDLPGSPFAMQPTMGAWLSADEKLIYLQGSPNYLQPHIFIVDTQKRALIHDFELRLPYPSNVDMAFPMIWKLPWAEALAVVCRDQLFIFDLATGKSSNSIMLFDAEAVERVPKNLPQTAYIQDGILDADTHQLFLATSTQEIVFVDLNAQPFTIQRVVSLPTGWQFGVANPLLLNPKEKTLYVQVKRGDTLINNGLEVDEVWEYDSITWAQKASLNLREQLANAPSTLAENSAVTGLDLTNYGLAWTGQGVYSLTRMGLLHINQDSTDKLSGNWLNMNGNNAPYLLMFAVP